VTRLQADMENVRGLSLIWKAPLPGVRVGASYLASVSNFAADITYSGTIGPSFVSIPTRTETRYELVNSCVGSVEYSRGDLKLVAEYYRDKVDNGTQITGLPGPPLKVGGTDKGEAWYVQGSYRVNDRFQVQAYYSVYWPDRSDKDGKRFARQGQEFRAWMKDLAITGRVDINRHWLVKLEFHRIDGGAGLSLVENPGGITKDWDLFAVKTTLHF